MFIYLFWLLSLQGILRMLSNSREPTVPLDEPNLFRNIENPPFSLVYGNTFVKQTWDFLYILFYIIYCHPPSYTRREMSRILPL